VKNSLFRPRSTALIGLILLAAFSRLLPLPPNFAPITAMALFGAAYFDRKRLVFLVPLGAMVLSDLTMEILFHKYQVADWGGLPLLGVVYGTFALIAGLAIWLRRHVRPLVVMCAAPVGSILFFLITNFAAWALTDDMPSPFGYPKTWAGLFECYVMGLPFFKWTLLGDVTFSAALFGSWAILTNTVPALQEPSPEPA